MPTGDSERYKLKFQKLLKFSKEVQVYLDICAPMDRLCEELGLTCPVTRVYMGQIDGQNDCLVLDNINKTGYVKCALSLSLQQKVS